MNATLDDVRAAFAEFPTRKQRMASSISSYDVEDARLSLAGFVNS